MAADPAIPVSPDPRRRLIFFSAAGLCLVFLGLLFPQLIARFNYQQSVRSLLKDDLAETELYLDEAKNWLHFPALANDRKRLAVVEGDLHLRKAETAKTVTAFVKEMEKAEELFRETVAIDPLDLDGYTGLAKSAAALEKVYPFVYKRPYTTKALPIFERLLVLMPANLYTYTLLTKYYHSHNMPEELNASIAQSITLYPPLYFQLKQQPFYSTAMNAMLKKSLDAAVAKDIFKIDAYNALADLALQENDYNAAIDNYLLAKPDSPYRDNSGYTLQLASLYLKAGQLPEAETAFLESLKTPDQERRLNEIWGHYMAKKQYNDFLSFCRKIEDKNLADLLEILQAKCLMEMGQPEFATSHLIRVNTGKYAAESLYLQGRIAEGQKDWDTMELRSQRATALDGKKWEYHLLFSRALQNQQKLTQAEQAATDAIRYAGDVNPWLYNHRAWIRWNRKDSEGARKDWEKAITIAPDTAGFYFSMAMTFEQGGNSQQAIGYLKKAIALKPDEQSYRKKLSDLETLSTGKK